MALRASTFGDVRVESNGFDKLRFVHGFVA